MVMTSTLLLAMVALVFAAPAVAAGEHCGECHGEQLQRWQLSLHARSTEDPLYRAMRDWARSEAGPQAAALCANCHTSEVLGQPARTLSVECTVCHQGIAVAPGPKGWKVDPTRPVATALPVEAPHPIRTSRELLEGRMCRACHEELRNPRGVPLCTTGPESESLRAAAGCLSCHMPGKDHAFPGTTPELLARAAELAIEFRGGEARVTVLNRGTGHALPTGSALRQIVLETEVLGANHAVLASHREVFARVLEDAAGHAPVPPWRAAAIHSDTRLARLERRVVRVDLPAGAHAVVARLVYHRAPAAVARRLGLADDPLLQTVEMTRAENVVSR